MVLILVIFHCLFLFHNSHASSISTNAANKSSTSSETLQNKTDNLETNSNNNLLTPDDTYQNVGMAILNTTIIQANESMNSIMCMFSKK